LPRRARRARGGAARPLSRRRQPARRPPAGRARPRADPRRQRSARSRRWCAIAARCWPSCSARSRRSRFLRALARAIPQAALLEAAGANDQTNPRRCAETRT
jgi:hypothetical protein